MFSRIALEAFLKSKSYAFKDDLDSKVTVTRRYIKPFQSLPEKIDYITINYTSLNPALFFLQHAL